MAEATKKIIQNIKKKSGLKIQHTYRQDRQTEIIKSKTHTQKEFGTNVNIMKDNGKT